MKRGKLTSMIDIIHRAVVLWEKGKEKASNVSG